MHHRRAVLSLVLAVSVALAPAVVQAQPDWPKQPVRLILPVAPGGTADVTARQLQAPLSRLLGQTVIVENRPGGAGTIATEYVARAKPDGYTLGLVFTSHAANPALLPKLPYDSEKDITPIAFFWRAALAISVNKNVPIHSIEELVDRARAQPGGLSYATGGVGQATHISIALLQQAAHIQMTHVPYRGGAPALSDVVADHVPVLSSGVGLASPYVRDGSLRMLAVTSKERSATFPHVPTMQEAGYPGYENSEWYGFIGPAGMPDPIVGKLNAAINEALQDSAVRAQFVSQDLVSQPMTPGEFSEYLKNETRRMTQIVKAADIRVN